MWALWARWLWRGWSLSSSEPERERERTYFSPEPAACSFESALLSLYLWYLYPEDLDWSSTTQNPLSLDTPLQSCKLPSLASSARPVACILCLYLVSTQNILIRYDDDRFILLLLFMSVHAPYHKRRGYIHI